MFGRLLNVHLTCHSKFTGFPGRFDIQTNPPPDLPHSPLVVLPVRARRPPRSGSREPGESLQGGFCRQKHSHRNTDSKIGPGGRKPSRKPKEKYQKPRKPTETQGPCTDLKSFCINALTVDFRGRGRPMCARTGRPRNNAARLNARSVPSRSGRLPTDQNAEKNTPRYKTMAGGAD